MVCVIVVVDRVMIMVVDRVMMVVVDRVMISGWWGRRRGTML